MPLHASVRADRPTIRQIVKPPGIAYPDTLPMAPDTENSYHWKHTLRGMVALAAVYCAVVYLVPKPAAVKPEGWRLTGIFIATIAGCVVQPIPSGALVLLAVTLAAIFGGLTVEQALAGYADKAVWLVMAAFFISRALVNTGLARRIALFFVRTFGKSSLGVSYALSMSDLVLAGVIPSNGARSGGAISADCAVNCGVVRLEAGRDGGAVGFVFDDGGVSEHLRHLGDVLHRPIEQSAGGKDRGNVRVSGYLGELDRGGHCAGARLHAGRPVGGDEDESAGGAAHAGSGGLRGAGVARDGFFDARRTEDGRGVRAGVRVLGDVFVDRNRRGE